MGDFIVQTARELTIRHEGQLDGLAAGQASAGRIIFAGAKAYHATTSRLVVRVAGRRVYIIDNAPGAGKDALLSLPWQAALQLARDVKQLALKHGAGVVQIIEGDRLLVEVPITSAFQLAAAIRRQAAQAEQNAKVRQVVDDQAFCMRAGIPIALSRNPAVLKEAGNEAAWSEKLRRQLPGGIPSRVSFGSPSVRPGRPAKGTIGVTGIPSGEVFGKIGGR